MHSMTGFAECRREFDGYTVMIRMKSVNGKYLDPQFRITEAFMAFESEISSILKERVGRGKVNVWVDIVLTKPEWMGLSVDPSLWIPIIGQVETLKDRFPNYSFTIPIPDLMQSQAVSRSSLPEEVREQIRIDILAVFREVLEAFLLMKKSEGAFLKKIFSAGSRRSGEWWNPSVDSAVVLPNRRLPCCARNSRISFRSPGSTRRGSSRKRPSWPSVPTLTRR
ncbi:MAG: hypothetical protein MZV49_13320 [Rhodopseudomonas palustris]|nr:hypothetical protein [Rhodopseudomonas palustris]